MYPTFFRFQGQGFHMWGLMLMFAFTASILVLNKRAKKVGIDPDLLVMFYQIIIIAALIGSRLLHFVFAEPGLFFANPLVFFDFDQGGFAFYGGAIGGATAGSWYIRRQNIPFWKFLDAAAPTLMLGLAVGRMGCFFAGCCHGRVVDAVQTGTLLSLPGGSVVTLDGLPLIAFNFVAGVGVGSTHGVPIFPTQAFESLGAFSVFAFLSWLWLKHRRFDGLIFGVLLMLYPILRSTIETFRGDVVRGTDWFGLFSTSQLVSIPTFLFGLGIVLVRMRAGFQPESPFVYEE
jgi:phosphatidylglycerol---prolipoprotein diacylglyceryl transferase